MKFPFRVAVPLLVVRPRALPTHARSITHHRVPAITVPSPTSWKIWYAANNPRPSFVPLPNSPLHTVSPRHPLPIFLFLPSSLSLSLSPSHKGRKIGAFFRLDQMIVPSSRFFFLPFLLPECDWVAFRSQISRLFFSTVPIVSSLFPFFLRGLNRSDRVSSSFSFSFSSLSSSSCRFLAFLLSFLSSSRERKRILSFRRNCLSSAR